MEQRTAAVATGGSRVFDESVKVTWTPTNHASVIVSIHISGAPVWTASFEPNDTRQHFDMCDDLYETEGTFAVSFAAQGNMGSLSSERWKWKVGDVVDEYAGVIGAWRVGSTSAVSRPSSRRGT